MKEMYMVTMHYWTKKYGDLVALLGVYDSKKEAEDSIDKESIIFELDKEYFVIDCIDLNKTYHLMSDENIRLLKEEYAKDDMDYHMDSYDYAPEMCLGGYVE